MAKNCQAGQIARQIKRSGERRNLEYEKTDEIPNRSTRMVDQIGHQASRNRPMALVRNRMKKSKMKTWTELGSGD